MKTSIANIKRICVMWGRAGRHFTGVVILLSALFCANELYKALNTDNGDKVAMTEDQLRVLRAFNPPLAPREITVNAENAPQSPPAENNDAINPTKGRSDALLQHLQQACINFNISIPVTDFMLAHMHFDHDRKAVYCFTPKVACTSWKRIWMKVTGLVKPDKKLEDIDRYVIHSSIPSLTSQKKMLPEILANYKKFMFVRHPFERVLSAFKDKIEHEDTKSAYNFHLEIGRRIQRKYRPVDKVDARGDNTTFPEFIRFISEPGRGTFEQRNEHWLTVHELCNPCSVKYDFIGKYEMLKEDADYVIDWLGMSNLVEKFPESQRSFHAKRYDPKYFNQLNHNEKLSFFQKYLQDFVAFNYTFL